MFAIGCLLGKRFGPPEIEEPPKEEHNSLCADCLRKDCSACYPHHSSGGMDALVLAGLLLLPATAHTQPLTLNDPAMFDQPVASWIDTASMTARWRFNGSLVDDVASYALSPGSSTTYTNGAVYCAGLANRYSLVNATACANALRGSNWTLSFWVSLDTLAASNYVLGVCETTTANGDLLGIYIRSDRVDVIGNSNNLYEFYPSANFASNTAYHIVLTRAGTTLSARVNGASAHPSLSVPAWTASGSDVLCLGNHYGSSLLYSTGWIDDLSIWTRTLTTDEISSLYAFGRQ
jgi:hypothetical protein